jgi:uncharacterized repeat protein (TIGR01451 family)
MVRGEDRRLSMGNPIRKLVLVAALLVPGSGALALEAGSILTNFTYGTFSLASGRAGGGVVAGYNILNVPNSQSAWVLITDEPQLCLELWKKADDGAWNPQATVVPGGTVCFTVSYRNCGNISVQGVTITDKMPANTVRNATPFKFSLLPVPTWATGIGGPWNTTSMLGQEGPLYIRWFIDRLGVGQSGYINYCVDVL